MKEIAVNISLKYCHYTEFNHCSKHVASVCAPWYKMSVFKSNGLFYRQEYCTPADVPSVGFVLHL
jgi:hypothetical protein